MKTTTKNCEDMSDKELVKRSLQDVDYFACIYERYEQKLIWYILRISSFSLEEAEDVLQEAFIKAWKNLNEFDENLKFSSWIYRIVHNTTITEWKKSRSYGKDKRQELDEEIFQNLPSSLDIEKEANQKFDKKNIQKVLRLMPENYREILVLKFLEEKNYKEISDILKKPNGTIATLINRAKKSFYETAKEKNISFII
ncbi:MAG: sigma-70 family RNA polymerase sigma factor [Candidatus Pacebacteria bacterium]|nr:sigma-70 family RNA polymerase sigma factor [Candidatus Paceibacterota bacterium]